MPPREAQGVGDESGSAPLSHCKGPGKETAGRESSRSTGLPGPRAPQGRVPLLLTYYAEAELPPLPPSCSWVSRRGGRGGRVQGGSCGG